MSDQDRIDEQDRIIKVVRQHAWALRQSGDSSRAESFEDVADYIDRLGRNVVPVVPVELTQDDVRVAVEEEIDRMVNWIDKYSEQSGETDHPLWKDACLTEHEAAALAELLRSRPWRP